MDHAAMRSEAVPGDGAPDQRLGDERLPVLDGLRGLAILMVMVTHFCTFGVRPFLDLMLAKAAALGWCGVDLFFVLSGYLITGILYDSKGGVSYLRTFYARRVLRIFPLYYGFLFVLFLIVPLFLYHRPELDHAMRDGQVWFWTYASNILFATRVWEAKDVLHIGHLWSLAVEEQFYVLWPFLVLLLSRRRLMWLCGGAMVLGVMLRYGMLSLHARPEAVYVLLPTRMDGLAVGAAIALASRGPDGLQPWRRPARTTLALAGMGFLGVAIQQRGFDNFGLPMQTFGYSFLALLLGAILVISLLTQPRLLADSRLVFLGRYSYAIYVFHPLCLILLPWSGLTPQSLPSVAGSHILGVLAFAVIASTISVTFAVISWHCYEKHFLKLKRWFPYRRRALRAPFPTDTLSSQAVVRREAPVA
jgi:peptidoglycan/LPS O-acetylase OafA/YrhL